MVPATSQALPHNNEVNVGKMSPEDTAASHLGLT